MTSLWIPHNLLAEVIGHCQRDLPREACGLLAGRSGKVEAVLPMPNVAANPEQDYLVEGAAQMRAFRHLSDKGCDLVGIYHSHPREYPAPSQSDIRQAYYSRALHLIIGLRNRHKPDVRAYRLTRDTGKAVRVRLETDSHNAPKLRGGLLWRSESAGKSSQWQWS